MKISAFFCLLLAMLSGCENKTTGTSADTIYFGGSILTMEDSSPNVEAIAVKDGKIIFSGKKSDNSLTKRFFMIQIKSYSSLYINRQPIFIRIVLS